MKISVLLLCLATTALGAGSSQTQPQPTQTGMNTAAISSALANLNPNPTSTANFDNISPPPKSLIPEILSVVPLTVLWELINPTSRSSLASEFSAGSTPAWYKSLPTDVKSYMSVVSSQIAAGALTATPTPAATSATATPSATAGASSTSSGLGAQATAGLGASVAGALGVLGVVLAL